MAYKVIIIHPLYMPSYFLKEFTEYPYGVDIEKQNATVLRQTYQT